MRKIIAAALILALTACASSAPDQFTIKQGKLQDSEIALDRYARVAFAARVFDVVNQDTTAEAGTGLAGKVEPMPADILSAYAAKKFRAEGGNLMTRFVIRGARLTSNPVAITEKGWLWGWPEGTRHKVELTADLAVMLVASRPDGRTAMINAETRQVQQITADTTPAERRKAYLDMMARGIDALDAEFSKRLPEWQGEVVLR